MQASKLESDALRLFIDGYNVIGTDPLLKRLKQRHFEAARERLRADCRHYASFHPGHILYLVFDGDETPDNAEGRSPGQMLNERQAIREFFTEKGQSADDWILGRVSDTLPGDSIAIVSNDCDLIRAGQMHGSSGVSVEAFLSECRRIGKRKSRHPTDGSRGREESVSIPGSRRITDELMTSFADELDKPVEL